MATINMVGARVVSTAKKENELAQSLGWVPKPDPSRGAGWCLFKKGSEVVWKCSSGRWARAKLTSDRVYIGHKYFNSLNEAFGVK